MRILDGDGWPTLRVSLGKMWNWHQLGMGPPLLAPTSIFVSEAVEAFLERHAPWRGLYVNQLERFYWCTSEWPDMDDVALAEWHVETFPALLRRELGYAVPRRAEDVCVRCGRWHARVVRARELEELQPEQVAAVLEAAALALRGRLHSDALGHVLRQAAAALARRERWV